MKRTLLIANICICALFTATTAFPCTTFILQGDGRLYFGRNLDWDWQDALILVNARNVQKTAFVLPGHTPAKWKSKYGSVTFNQFGQEMPFGGMNEVGLVVENMWLDDTKYPDTDSRPEINMLQWIQYQLDNCKTVNEVIATDSKIRLEQPPIRARIHYLVCDASGDCATIECLNGVLVTHHGGTLPSHALANDTYDNSQAFALAHPVPAGAAEKLKDTGSLQRFTLAAARATRFKPATPEKDMQYAFETLDQVCQGNYTVWRVVYDIAGRQIHFRTEKNTQERVIDLKKFDFDCHHPVPFADIQSKPNAVGAVEFQDLAEAQQAKYLRTFVSQDSLKKGLGDLTLLIEGMLLSLRGNTCAE